MPLGNPTKPAEVQANPYLPGGPPPLVCEMWDGINTQTNRAGVDDKQVYWLDGLMPYAPRRLRAMYGVGATLFTAAGGLSVIFYKFVNLGAVPYCMVVMSDGSLIAVRTDTLAQKTVMTASTLVSPDQLHVDINQWGSQYVLIVSTQPNGYWVWDGNVLYTAGGIGPVITVTNAGAGYSSTPSVLVSGGHGSGVILLANINNGQVTSVSVVNSGSGYQAGDTPSITFSGGTSSGSGGTLTAVLTHTAGGSGGTVSIGGPVFNGSYYFFTTASVVTGGSGYSQFAVVTVNNGSNFAYTPAQLQLTIVGGIITAVSVANGGAYVNTNSPSPVVSDAGGYYVSSVTVNNVGSGYSPSTKVTGSGGGSPVSQATYQPVINSGTITSVTVLSGGQYGSNTPPTLAVTDTSTTATATLSLMPFAVNGSAVETYSGQVWITNGAVRLTSAPGSVVDFATSDGGLNVMASDSTLKVGYTSLLNTNGFLYLVGDCSVNYISGVQTSGTPPVTNYTYQNADPEVGTSWPRAVIPWGNTPALANHWGVHLLYGSKMVKISDPLDGVYGTVPVASYTITPSMAKATFFDRKLLCLLLPIIDPVTLTQQNKLLMWDGKRWWSTLQDVTLKYIATQELNSDLTAYGTDGTHVYPLFAQASTAFTKTVQTKLWDNPGYLFAKGINRFWGIANYNSTLTPNLIVSIDSEKNAKPYSTPSSTYTITGPTQTGYFITPPQAVGQQGVLVGMTVKTNAADVELVSIAMDDEVVEYRG